MAHLHLSLFGPFLAWVNGRSQDEFESDKVRALLSYLAVEAGQPHRRSELAGLLWPDSSESAARASLRNALSNLRLVIHDRDTDPAHIICERETIRFNLSSSHWIDSRAFEEKAAASRDRFTLLKNPDQLQLLTEAAELYQGNFLQGFSLRDSPAFEEWQLLKREYFMQQAVAVMTQLADFFEQKGDSLLACEYAQRLVLLAPWHEEAHRSLMRLFAKIGQRSLALEQFEFCRRSLDQELDVQPGGQTIKLYEQIRDGYFLEAAEAAARKDNLPAELSPLVGRIGELVEIERQLAVRSCRLLTLIGPGGSGKTRLALEVAHRQLEHFRDGVYIISLEPFQSVEAVTTAIARELGLNFPQVDHPQDLLLAYLRPKNLLFILDSFEHILEAAGLVVDIMRAAEGVKILITSRVRINIQDEHLFPLGGLSYPDETVKDVDRALFFDAIRLFLEGAQRLQPTYRFADQDIEPIVTICQQVQGMPLAILLAASWCTTLPVPEIAFELRKNCLDFLRTDWRDLPERQRSIQAVFEHSYNLLKEDEKRIFEGLGVFQGGFSYQAAHSVVQADLFRLRRLVDKTMIRRSDAARFELHDLLRLFALQKLTSRPRAEYILREKHLQFYTAALKDLAVDLQGPRQSTAVHNLLPDLPNIQSAWNRAVERRNINCLDKALDGLCGIYQWLGRYAEGESACQAAINCLKTGLPEGPGEVGTCLLVRLLAWQAYFANILGQIAGPKRAIEQAFQALANLDPEKEDSRLARAFLLQQAGLYYLGKDHVLGRDCLLESLALYRETGWRWREAHVLETLAMSGPQQDANKQSRHWLEESLAIRRELGDQVGVASALQLLSIAIGAHAGDFDRMDALLKESLECSQMTGAPAVQADLQYLIAIRLTYLGRFSEALMLIKEAVRRFDELGIQDKLSQTLSIQSWIEMNLGDYIQGRAHIEASNEIAIRANTLSLQALNLYGLGEIEVTEGLFEHAIETLRESVRLYRQCPQIDEMGMALSSLALVEERLGLHELAIQDLREGVAIGGQAASWQAKLILLANYARFLAEQGNLELAIDLYALATRHPYLGNSSFWWDFAGKRIEELSARISREVREAAEQRGRLRNLDEAFDEIRIVFLSDHTKSASGEAAA